MGYHSEKKLPAGWKPMEESTRANAWNFIYSNLNFRPSIYSNDWPGISEPFTSETYSIAHTYRSDESWYQKVTFDLCRFYHATFKRTIAVGDYVLALNWQHPCYKFYPHSDFDYQSEDDWPVPALPNGDYFIFMTRDMKNCFFGHPWEQSICIYGDGFTSSLKTMQPIILDKKIRSKGEPLDELF